jgi:hypothetical protein
MRKSSVILSVPDIDALIVTVRDQKVILDASLALIYGVETGALNRAIKRNAGRFPGDFRFQLTAEDATALRCQIGISNRGRGGRRYLPHAFTEHGAMMAANILNSDRAVEMSVYVIRAFVKMRAELAKHHDLARRLAEIEKTLIGHDTGLRDLYNKIRPLLVPEPEPKRREIGFHAKPENEPAAKGRKR